MGKGGGSCLKIIACAGDPTDTEDAEPSEGKASSSKRKWGFRKRSTSHRVLSNHVVNESTTLVENVKKIPENDSNNRPDPSVPAKIPVVKFVEPTLLSEILESEASDSVSKTEEARDSDSVSKELPTVIIIQSAIRGYLARKELRKLKQIVKLQAAVRGHLVRRQAVGTLRCVQAIFKIQALVRARCLRSSGKLVNKEVKEISHEKQNRVHSSKRLFENRFGCRLLETTPSKKTKVIYISCDPSRSDSAWEWLERWMSVTSLDVPIQHEIHPNTCIQEENILVRCFADGVVEGKIAPASHPTVEQQNEGIEFGSVEMQIANVSPPSDSILDCESEVPFDCVIDDKTKCTGLEPPTLLEKKGASSQDGNLEMFKDSEITKESCDSDLDQSSVKSDAIMQSDMLSERHAIDLEKSRRTTRRMDESQENVGKKFGYGMRKTCSPAFAAVQSKFEEMSSMPNTSRPFDSYEGNAEDKNSDSFTPQTHASSKLECDSMEHRNSVVLMPDNDTLSKQEFSFVKDSPSREIRVQTMTSECGTEISISSTLDSPDRSEPEGGEIVLEISTLERRDYDEESTHNFCDPDSNSDTNRFLTKNGTEGEPILVENDGQDNANRISNTMVPTSDKQLSVEPAASDTSVKLDDTIDQQAYKPSPEGSPRSHITASESHGTPASQVSINTKRSKQNMASERPRFQLTGKSPANKTMEADAKFKSEHPLKDPKSSKRRNSMGTTKPERSNLEPRSSSSSSLPSYMQATESARAKVHASNSPKASPDVHGKDSYHRKRHSLPLSNGKQGSSPHTQLSTPQAQQSSKGTGVNSPHTSERKWQR